MVKVTSNINSQL